ncbi:MAG: hypothetical protein WB791_08085 [Waddliaceae bacterium]
MTMQLLKSVLQGPTLVTYPQRITSGSSTLVAYALRRDHKLILFLERTPFHPVDSRWPDQPSDRGTLSFNQKKLEVIDCRILALKGQDLIENKECKERDLPRLIGHVVEYSDGLQKEIDDYLGQEIEVEVEEEYRNKISLHHTACHLAALALNMVMNGLWKKQPTFLDSFNNGDFDKLAIQQSFIREAEAEDFYRFNSKIKKYFNRDEFTANASEVQKKVNKILEEWIQSGSIVSIETQDQTVMERRIWRCNLPEGEAKIPCGGTHVSTLSCFEKIEYTIALSKDGFASTTKAWMK